MVAVASHRHYFHRYGLITIASLANPCRGVHKMVSERRKRTIKRRLTANLLILINDRDLTRDRLHRFFELDSPIQLPAQ